MNPIPNKSPENMLRIEAWRDLTGAKEWQAFLVTPQDGDPHTITVRRNNRIVLDALIAQPVLCASPVRLPDKVSILKNEYGIGIGIGIETKMYDNDAATDRAKFGVYLLKDAVTPIDGRAS
ncbi:hypothetical protein [uncultured Litoreibacter sp.]|uniref:hypothetical protein n=1 Tax=uncultured Litoreibacter sp. TaxID=1392394 RepID=UPI002630FB31|nr:hypothetical protein [uncultured Litoreibacter sp.]